MIRRRSFAGGAVALASPIAAAALTDAQRRWSAEHQGLRFAPEQDYGPFVFADASGQLRGLSIDMLELVRRQTGLDVVPLPPRPLAPIMADLKQGRADFVSSLRPTPERQAFLAFTRPYVEVPAVLAVGGSSPPTGLAQLAGRPVAVGAGYAVEAYVRQRHPRIDWIAVADDGDAVAGVIAGRYAAAVLDVASLAFVTDRLGVPRLQVVEAVGFTYALCFAVRKDLPQLRELLDAGLQAVPAAQRQAVVQRWLGPYADQLGTPLASVMWRVGLGCLVGAALVGAIAVARRRATATRSAVVS